MTENPDTAKRQIAELENTAKIGAKTLQPIWNHATGQLRLITGRAKPTSELAKRLEAEAKKGWEDVIKQIEEKIAPGDLLDFKGERALLDRVNTAPADTPDAAMAQLDAMAASKPETWGFRTLTPIWRNAKEKLNALELDPPDASTAAQIAGWEAVVRRIEHNLLPGDKKALNEPQRLRSLYSALGDAAEAAMVPKRRARASAATTPLQTLVGIFGTPKKFYDLPVYVQPVWELVWELSPDDRISFVVNIASAWGQSAAAKLTPGDKDLINAWFAELVRQTHGVDDLPASLVFAGRYIRPGELTLAGLARFFRLVEHFFDGNAQHSGGLSTDMTLESPKKDKIGRLLKTLQDAYNAPRPPTDDSPPDDDNEVDIEALPAPARLSIGPDDVGSALAGPELDGIGIDRGMFAALVYSAKMRLRIDAWLDEATITQDALTQEIKDNEPAVRAELAAVEKLRASHKDFEASYRSLLAAVKREREVTRRLRMTDAEHAQLVGEIRGLRTRFTGLFTAKADMMRYLQQQLAGSRPRAVTANHVLGLGEPGTGKTTMMSVFGRMMILLGLIEPASLAAYTTAAKAMRANLTAAETDAASAAEVEGLPASLGAFRGFGPQERRALQILSTTVSASEARLPMVVDPSKFESAFEGGVMAQFNAAVLATLGSVLIIDEAYGLGQPRFRQLVDGLVASTTQFGLQWGTVLLGYEDSMEKFLRESNEGLQRRYATRIRFGFFSALELAAILAAEIASSDRLLLASGADAVERVDDGAIDGVLSDLYYALVRYAIRDGAARVNNKFGMGNAGSVQKLRGIIETSGKLQQFAQTSSFVVVTPEIVRSTLEEAEPLAGFTRTVAYAEPGRAL